MRRRRLLIVALAGVAIGLGSLVADRTFTTPHRTTPVYDPPVLAGQRLWGYCSGGVYARHGEQVVLTSTGHCTPEGTVAYDPDGVTRLGVFGPAARDATCPYAGHTCASSDINYLVLDPSRIPWGHLNVIDMGTGGYRTLAPETRALACGDIKPGDRVEIDGRGEYRPGSVIEKGDNDRGLDGELRRGPRGRVRGSGGRGALERDGRWWTPDGSGHGASPPSVAPGLAVAQNRRSVR